MSTQAIGLYIHIPFCRDKCPYCDFYSLPYDEELADAYVAKLVHAIKRHPFGKLWANTLYLGGGTPSLLGARRLCDILQAAARFFGLGSDSEITLEANPEAVSPTLLVQLRQEGYNRISFGVQSLDAGELADLGRSHSPNKAQNAILAAQAAGFSNISADLMLAIPEQGSNNLSRSIRLLSELPLTHISSYLLKLEPHVPMAQKKAALPNEDAAADLYLQCVDELAIAGFAQYEVSNFARPGYQSRHNLKYWRREPYLGLGPAAHSFLDGRRFFFPPQLECFTKDSQFDQIQHEPPNPVIEEELMLRLRLTEGFDTALVAELGGNYLPLLKEAERLATHGLCRVEGRRICLTPKGFLLSNSITAQLLEAIC
ncbi:MAG: radical SAM family heme chaperone HemW [Oscillospiraceae bacterium]|nr:radical SAM family heme chaperone HemW [Oscillospiraceae bacterium]